MKRFVYESIESLCLEITDMLDEITRFSEYEDISIVCKYEETKQVLNSLACFGCDLYSIEMCCPDLDGYKDEFLITLYKEDDSVQVWCSPFKYDKEYLTEDSSITYIFDNCSSKLIKNVNSEIIVEVCIEEDFDEDCCDCCECCTCHDNEEYYEINGKPVSQKEFNDFKEKMDEKINYSLKTVLNKYCSVMDELNELNKLFRL